MNSSSRTSLSSVESSPVNSSYRPLKRRVNEVPPTRKYENTSNWALSTISNGLSGKHVIDEEESGRMRNNLSFDAIKPRIGFSKYLQFCGVEKGQNTNGCQCPQQPCKWSVLWCSNLPPKQIYRSLLSRP